VFRALSKIFEGIVQEQEQAMEPSLALAVLLVEVASADTDFDPAEQVTIGKILAATFNLSQVESQELLTQATGEQQDSISIQTYTSVLIKHLDRPHRIEFIQAMWQVAYADGELDGHEEFIIRKIADLIYLSHSDYIKAKLEVQAAN